MSKRALASTPWVGSSISTTLAPCRKLARQHRLLLVAAGQAADRLIQRRRRDFELLDQRSVRARVRFGAETSPPGGEVLEHLHRHVLAHAEAGKIDSRGRSALSERMPASSASRGGRSNRTGTPAQTICAARRLEAAERTHRFALAVALGAGEIPGSRRDAHRSVDVAEARTAQALDRQHDVSVDASLSCARILRFDRPPDHQGDQVALPDSRRRSS